MTINNLMTGNRNLYMTAKLQVHGLVHARIHSVVDVHDSTVQMFTFCCNG